MVNLFFVLLWVPGLGDFRVQNWWPEVRRSEKTRSWWHRSWSLVSHTRCYAMNLSSSMKYVRTSNFSILPNSRGFLLFWLTSSVFFLAHFPVTSHGVGKLVQDHGQSWHQRNILRFERFFLKLWMPAQIPFNMTSWRLFCDKSECQCIKW